MSGTLAIARGIFVEARPRVRSAAIGPPRTPPVVAVLCAPACARTAAAAVALALARVTRRQVALAAAVGVGGGLPVAATVVPAARRAATRLRKRGQPAMASGRLVWLGEARLAWAAVNADAAGVAAAASAALGRAAGVVGAPAALAIPLARTTALDRILRWHDGIVVVHDDDAADPMIDCVRRSLAGLDRPVVEMSHPARLPATAAALGIAAPAVALQAVAELGFGDGGSEGGRS